MAHELPKLPYDFAALEPHIDTQTMQIHHGKHHQASVNNLNAALEKHPSSSRRASRISAAASTRFPKTSVPPCATTGAATGITAGSGSGWPSAEGAPTGKAADAIHAAFGTFDAFKDQWGKAGAERFRSGWVWLINNAGKLSIASTRNQDNPLMDGTRAILGLDVGEHATT